ncbi:MAG: glucodextranase DOMON-like domain-containing protein [Elusimicrobiota bacterium]|nr:glucodextranase DOMON-like domain-containing protein [Elusimicrobiota bacterium]
MFPGIRKLSFFLLFCLCGSVYGYSLLIDASGVPSEQVPDCINFIAATKDIPYRIVLPDAMEPWEKRIICVLAEKSEFGVVGGLNPNVWMRGVVTLGVSDLRDILAGNLMKQYQLSDSAAEEIFIGAQMPDEECFRILDAAGIKTVFCVGEGFSSKHGPTSINVFSCLPAQSPADAADLPLYRKVLTFDGFAEQLLNNKPTEPEIAPGDIFHTRGGIVLSDINLKMWEHFSEARKKLENYKNSGRAERDKLTVALEKTYSVEELSNWTEESSLETIFYAVAGIYEAIEEPLPENYATIAGMLFDELREIPISVSEDFFAYTISAEDGYMNINGNFSSPVSTAVPLGFYWWNPAAGYSTRFGVDGRELGSPVNFCISCGEKNVFYRAGQNEWERMWSVSGVERSSCAFSVRMPMTFMQLSGRTNISFFIRLSSSVRTRPLAISLPTSSVKKKWLDPIGDAKGPGWYIPAEGTPSGMCDIMSLALRKNRTKIYLQFYFAGPVSAGGFHSGFDLYIDINGIKKKGAGSALPGLNCFMQEGAYWEYCLRVSSGAAILIKGEKETVVPLKFDSSFRIATVTIPKADFPYDPSLCGLTFVSYRLDGKGKVLEVRSEKDSVYPGGGRPQLKSPNVFDIITPGHLAQKHSLGAYLKKRGAVIPVLP